MVLFTLGRVIFQQEFDAITHLQKYSDRLKMSHDYLHFCDHILYYSFAIYKA